MGAAYQGDKLATEMSASPSISVVVPFFNSQRHIGACVDSLSNQKGVDGTYELIFVNNRSTDASADRRTS